MEHPFHSEWIGEKTLYLFYNIKAVLGMEHPNLYIPLEFIYTKNFSINIYTALRRYYQDYYFLGIILTVFILGLGYKFFYKYAKAKKGKYLIYFACFYFPIFEFWIEERFFMSIISSRTIYIIFWIEVLSLILLRRKK